MEAEKETFRFYNFTLMKLGDSPLKNHQELESVYGTSCSYDTACWWIRRPQSGKEDLRNEPLTGAPKTATNENTNTIELVIYTIADDPYISNESISQSISQSVSQTINQSDSQSVKK